MSNKRKQQQMTQSSSSRQRPPLSASVDSDDGGGVHPRRAFRVLGSPDFSQAEPQSALEYLRRVKWEAKRQPKVWTAAIDPQRLQRPQPPQPTMRGHGQALDRLPRTSPLALPSSEWQSHFASQYTDVRMALLRYTELHPVGSQPSISGGHLLPNDPQLSSSRPPLPSARDYPAWLRFCLGADFDVERCTCTVDAAEGEVDELSTPQPLCPSPKLQLVAGWDQLSTRAIIHRLVDHLHRCHQRILTPPQPPQQRNNADPQHTPTLVPTPTPQDDDDQEEEDKGEGGEEADADGELVRGSIPTASIGFLDAVPGQSISAMPAPPPSSTASPLSVLGLPRASHTVWLYAALAHLEKPLPADVGVQLRQLYRVCGKIRAQAGGVLEERKKASQEHIKAQLNEEVTNAFTQTLPHEAAALDCAMRCNLLMTIVDKVFGQRVDLEQWLP